MISFLNNLRAYFVAALSVCLSLIVFGSGPSARAQESKAKATGEQQQGKDAEACDAVKNERKFTSHNGEDNYINVRPLKDWFAQIDYACKAGQLDLIKTLDVSIGADTASDTKLTNWTTIRSQGDEIAIRLATDFIAAIYDSNALSGILRSIKPDRLVFDIKLDESNVSAGISFDAPSVEKATEYATNFTTLLFMAQMSRAGRLEDIYFKNSRVSANGKQVLFNLTISRQLAGELLTKHLSST